MTTKDEALRIALEALESIALAGMSGTGQESEEAMTEWHARRAWEFIGTAARAITAIKQSQEPVGKILVGDAVADFGEIAKMCRLYLDSEDGKYSARSLFTRILCCALAEPAPKQAQDGMAGAYTGAREDLAIWKRRALEAEELNRKFAREINGPTFMGEPALTAHEQRCADVATAMFRNRAGEKAIKAELTEKAEPEATDFGHGYDTGYEAGRLRASAPEGYKLAPVEPDELWMYRVIRHHQPDLEVGSKAWLDCAREVLHWHPAMLAAAPTPPEAK
jgi:hypothetical protein